MSPSTEHKLPRTNYDDAKISEHYDKVCKLHDRLAAMERNGTAALAVMTSTPSQKRASTGALKQEAVDSHHSLRTDFVHHCKQLGMYLGMRLFKKYSNLVTTMLNGNDGYAILNLVPTSELWTSDKKEKLLLFFWLEIEPPLGPIEAIRPTLCQVNMRKLPESFLDDPDATPLTSAFFKALNGATGTLFPLHTFRSFQLLQTSVGVPIIFPPGMNSYEREKILAHNAPVSLEAKQSVTQKRALVAKRFLPPVPHLVR